jgi:MFS family permease
VSGQLYTAKYILMVRRYQSRAFLLLPMCANIGVIVGPLLGGLTSDPVANYPGLFGGIRWLEKFPYSPPNLLSAIFLFSAVLTVFFGLEEVSTIIVGWILTNLIRLMIPSEIDPILGE